MSENKIILYDEPSFGGLSLELTKSQTKLARQNFSKAASSLRVIGQPWVAYTQNNYEGEARVYEEGNYSNIDVDNKIMSLYLILSNLGTPFIKLFEGEGLTGKSIDVQDAAILNFGKLENGASSWQVLSGAWKICDEVKDNPRYKVSSVGDMALRYSEIGLSHSALSVYPLLPGKPKFTTNVQWDRKKELSNRVSQLDEIIIVNKSKHEQDFSHSSGRDYTSSLEVEMKFSNETSIELGTSFKVPVIGELSTTLTQTISIEKGKTESKSTTVTNKVKIPVTVPGNTKVTINVMRRDISYSVPVEIIIERNKLRKTEYAELICRDGTDVHISRNDEAV
ncbi:epidermal differentiation-specific protein-like [Bombina bombina]|uniref:epidermal differentiation-specific protein-like n=1 Tax=Bombina bombina TaxID=8345 RepID=UPI00235B1997|nr:epidermal differentiation-specific protein-like [Bombina bombina]